MPGIFGPDGQPAGGMPVGVQIAAPMNDVQLVALMAAKLVAECPNEPERNKLIEGAVGEALQVVASAFTRIDSGELQRLIDAEKERLAVAAREAAIARVTASRPDAREGSV